jgi:adenosylcobinamide-phosphate synthase
VTVVLAMLAAVLLDAMLGEPARAHPLVAFGRWARAIERRCYADRRDSGVLAWMLAVLPVSGLVWLGADLASSHSSWLALSFEAVTLYLTLGLRSLADHALPVAQALERDELVPARTAVGRMVSRDTHSLDATQVSTAATESVLENGNDAVFGALFWFALAGAPGAVLYRLANTLDAMWGYRNARYEHFGWAAARIDDLLNLVPARLTALTYALLGRPVRALRCWRTQASRWDSPNAGPVMAAGAGALGVKLGGAAPYDGVWQARPGLGEGAAPTASNIRAALQLVRRGVVLWLVAVCAGAWAAREWLHA